MRQQRADYTLEDLLALPDDAPRVELVDGVIHETPSPTLGHQNISSLLWLWLHSHAPAQLHATQAVGVALSHNTSRQPDVVLHRAGLPAERSRLRPADVVLAVEIVSPAPDGSTGSPSRVSTPPPASRSTGASNRTRYTCTRTGSVTGSGRAGNGSTNSPRTVPT
ncbi:Uma2 family endonuclease [Micromonospora fiedleri]|uniref:Uma2 family endonuclease n=1 Tax=Micromonospora fiedleri TaxID=1157498 RepID=UPI0027DABEB7|nr:Uma2 family endonuclease [Micromonospora fiedleri]